MIVTFDLVSGELCLDADDGSPPRCFVAPGLRVAVYGDVIVQAKAEAGSPALTIEVLGEPRQADSLRVTRSGAASWRVVMEPRAPLYLASS